MSLNIIEKLDEIKMITTISVKEILTTKESAWYTGLSESYIHKLCQNGCIRHFKSQGGKINYIHKADLIAWMTNKEVRTTKEIIAEANRF